MLGGCMAKPNGLPSSQAAPCRGQASLPPKIPSPALSPAPVCFSVPSEKPVEIVRPSSTDVLTEEVPCWFEDLLNEPESPANRAHRRSASDPFAYLAASSSANGLWFRHLMGEPNHGLGQGHGHGPPTYVSRKPNHAQEERDNTRKSGTSSPSLPNGLTSPKEEAELKALGMTCTTSDSDKATLAATDQVQNQGDGSENSSGGSDCSQIKPPSAPKPDAKRKQHNARRSRVRKLQYIAELERNAHALQLEGAEVSAQLELLDQQNLILAMENRALKQRLENLSQEQFIKSLEQELLDRELARLQYLHHLQNLNHHQQRQRQKQVAAHRRGRSCDLDSHFAKLHLHPPQPVATSNGFKEPQRN